MAVKRAWKWVGLSVVCWVVHWAEKTGDKLADEMADQMVDLSVRKKAVCWVDKMDVMRVVQLVVKTVWSWVAWMVV